MDRRGVIKGVLPACEAALEKRWDSPSPNLTSQWACTFSSADASSGVGSVVDILGELDEDDVEWLLTVGRCRELQPGQVLIEHGLEADGLFVVAQGGLTVVDGAGRTLDTVGPGHGATLLPSFCSIRHLWRAEKPTPSRQFDGAVFPRLGFRRVAPNLDVRFGSKADI
jgi:hypothetical protein